MIIVKLKGGLGNQMFQYAMGRALSIKNNVSLKLDLAFLLDRTPRPNFTFRDYDLDVFDVNVEFAKQNEIPFLCREYFNKNFMSKAVSLVRRFVSIKGEEKSFSFDSSKMLMGGNAYLNGYWQSPKYFSEIEDTIRKDFTFKNEMPENVKTLAKEIKNCNSLCIHVRRTDYVGNKDHEVVGKDYYDQGIRMIKEKSGIDKIFVFSDDIKWCEQNLKFEFPTMFVGEEYAGFKASGHLYLMTQCKNFVIPNSSYSWWSAWLSSNKSKVVVVPKNWFPDTSIDTSDIIPSDWIRI